MKIAVPSREGQIDQHFGHCKEFLVFTAHDDQLTQDPAIPSSDSCGCKSGIAGVLAQAGVTHLVAGNMGEGALKVLQDHGITVVRGASGRSREAVEEFVAGRFHDSGELCSSHHDSCSNH